MKKLVLIVGMLLFSNSAKAEEHQNLELIYNYLNSNVMGKTTQYVSNSDMDSGKFYQEFKRSTSYSKLLKGTNSITFTESWLVNNKRFPKKDGEIVRSEVKESNVQGFNVCHINTRNWTTKLMGICSVEFSNKFAADPAGNGFLVTLVLVNGNLELTSESIGYHDHNAAEGTKPGKSFKTSIFSIVNEKLKVETKSASFYFDPISFDRVEESKRVDEYLETEK